MTRLLDKRPVMRYIYSMNNWNRKYEDLLIKMLSEGNFKALVCKKMVKFYRLCINEPAFRFMEACFRLADNKSYKAVSYAASEFLGWLTPDQEIELIKAERDMHCRMKSYEGVLSCLKRLDRF